MDPKVSIIVPMINTDIYLRKCLDSLVAQTLDALEVILVNDGSIDYTEDIALEYVKKYPERFSYFKKKKTGKVGKGAAKNMGLAHAHAPYVSFIDSSDYVAVDIYKKMYDKAEHDGADIVCCGYSRIHAVKEDPDEVQITDNYRFYAMVHSGHSIYDYPSMLIEGTGNSWNKLYRRSLFSSLEFPENLCFEDVAVIYALMESAQKVSYINETGYYFRGRNTDLVLAGDQRIFDDLLIGIKRMLSHFDNKNVSETFYHEITYIAFQHLLDTRTALLKKASAVVAQNYVNQAYEFLDSHYPDWQINKYHLKELPLTSPRYEEKRAYYHNKEHVIGRRFMGKKTKRLCQLSNKSFNIIRQALGRGKKTNKKNSQHVLPPKTLFEIQAQQRSILSTIHTFCAENSLQYYATEGTLLGTIRHGGFVPWDDDMDLAMPRKDYEKLIALWGKRSISGCVLMSIETYENHYLPFIKIVQNTNIKYTTENRKAPPFFQGLSIDIFPLDKTVPCNTEKELHRLRSIRVVRDMLLYKVGGLKNNARKFNCVIRGVHFRSIKRLQTQLRRLCTQYNNQDQQYLSNLGSSYAPSREIFPKDWWGTPKEHTFDDTVIMIPERAEDILCTIYGAYQEKPPESEQVCKHNYKAVKNDGTAAVY